MPSPISKRVSKSTGKASWTVQVRIGTKSDGRPRWLTKTFEKHFGATWAWEADPVAAARWMIDCIDRRRADLGLPLPMYEVPYEPKTAETVGAGAPSSDAEPGFSGPAGGGCRGPAISE